jgi:hypothetical protein
MNLIKIFFAFLIIFNTSLYAAEQRYTIFETASETMLLDKEDGSTWVYSATGWRAVYYPIVEDENKSVFCFTPRGEVFTLDKKTKQITKEK